MLPTRDIPQVEEHTQTERKGVEKDISCKQSQNKAGLAVLILDNIDFKTKTAVRDKEGLYIMVKSESNNKI